MIRAVGLPVEEQMDSLEGCSKSWRQSHWFPRHQSLSRRPAHRQAHACVGLVITATTAVAAARPVMGPISGDGHLRRHDAALDEGQAHAEPQQDRQEQNARPMQGPAFHGRPKMALLDANGKSL